MEYFLDLTAVEYKLLCLFMRNPNMVLTKEQIWIGYGTAMEIIRQ